MRTGLLSVALAASVALACGGGDDDGGGGGSPGADAAPALFDVPITTLGALDILFVIDDSATMEQEQQALAAAVPAFLAELTAGDQPVDVQIGFVSSNLGTAPEGSGGSTCAGEGDEGRLLVAASCPALTDGGRYLVVRAEAGGAPESNAAGDLAAQLECMALLGTDGCGFEEHLESMRRALMDQEQNAGFLRAEANLAVIVLADEDDCSASDRHLYATQPAGDTRDSPLGELSSFRCFEFGVACAGDPEGEREVGPREDCAPDEGSDYIEPVATYADFLAGLKGGSHRVAFAAIVGDVAPVSVGVEPGYDRLWVEPQCRVCADGSSDCVGGQELVAAFPAIRLNALADRFASRAQVEDICAFDPRAGALDYTAALAGIGARLRADGGTRCLASAPADRDPDSDGVQPVCQVTDGGQAIPSCDQLSAPCWYLASAPECAGSGTALVIDRGGTAPAGELAIRCAAAAP